jgi:hypothetical protein
VSAHRTSGQRRDGGVVSRGLVLAGVALLTACTAGSVAPAPKPSWEITASPQVTVTDEVRVVGNDLADGTYWASVSSVSGSGDLVFNVTRVRFGEVCLAWAAEMLRDDACLNDYGVEEYPEAFVSVSPLARVSVATPDGPGRNLRVDTATLRLLLVGDAPPLPDGYFWVPFPFIVTVEDATVVEAHQLWVP